MKSLIGFLAPFKNTLTELIFDHYPYNVPLMHLLKSLPKLTHLTLHFCHGSQRRTPQQRKFQYIIEDEDANTNSNFTSNLVYLYLEVLSNFSQAFNSVLSVSPKLRALIVPNSLDFNGECLFQCNLINTRCPSLRYLVWNLHSQDVKINHTQTLNRWKMASTCSDYDEQVGTLREIIFNISTELLKTILPLLQASQQQLTHVYLNRISRSGSLHIRELVQLRLPKLKRLVLKDLADWQLEWIKFVKTCEQLENLELETSRDYELLYNIIEAIKPLEYLRDIRLRVTDGREHEIQGVNISHFLQKCPSLQSLDLSGLCVSDQDLLKICNLRTLQVLKLDMKRYENYLSLEGLLQAADRLQATESGIQTLKLARVYNLTDAVLERLGQVKNLSTVSIEYNQQITTNGAQAFVSGTHNGEDRSFYVYNCYGVSASNGKFWPE